MDRLWRIADTAPDSFVRDTQDITTGLVAQLLWNRGVTTRTQVEAFLNTGYEHGVHDPGMFGDMPAAVERIWHARTARERVCIYGDYDADGVTSSTLLLDGLERIGIDPANLLSYLPHREKEGYGLNAGAVHWCHQQGVTLIITCDCGISNREEIALAASLGIDVIVTDHHLVPEQLPSAVAIIHPLCARRGVRYPCPYLTGGAVAWKLVCALWSHARTAGVTIGVGEEKWLLDLVAISIIADMGKLVDECRVLVRFGLMVLNKTRRPGLRVLIEHAGVPAGHLDASHVGFSITPRLNAAGRMDHANTALVLLRAPDDQSARALVGTVEDTNTQRTQEVARCSKQALEIARSQPDASFVAVLGDFPLGILGLIASKLVEETGKPAIVAGRRHDGGVTASLRSLTPYNVMDDMRAGAQFLQKFGGHPQAAGCSLASEDAWQSFTEFLRARANAYFAHGAPAPELVIDKELPAAEITLETARDIDALAPYGMGNPTPLFVTRALTVVSADTMGATGTHARIVVSAQDGSTHRLVGFRQGELATTLAPGMQIAVAYELSINSWKGRENVDLIIKDIQYE